MDRPGFSGEPYARLADDPRFATAKTRADNDDALAETLSAVSLPAQRPCGKENWVRRMSVVWQLPKQVAEKTLREDEFFEAGYIGEVSSRADMHSLVKLSILHSTIKEPPETVNMKPSPLQGVGPDGSLGRRRRYNGR